MAPHLVDQGSSEKPGLRGLGRSPQLLAPRPGRRSPGRVGVGGGAWAGVPRSAVAGPPAARGGRSLDGWGWAPGPPARLPAPPWGGAASSRAAGGAAAERRGALPPPGRRGALRAGRRGRPGPARRAARRMESLAAAGGAASSSGRARRAGAFV